MIPINPSNTLASPAIAINVPNAPTNIVTFGRFLSFTENILQAASPAIYALPVFVVHVASISINIAITGKPKPANIFVTS